MRLLKRIGVVIGAIGAAGMLTCAGEPDPRLHLSAGESLIWFEAFFVGLLLGVAIWFITDRVERYKRHKAKMERKRIKAPL